MVLKDTKSDIGAFYEFDINEYMNSRGAVVNEDSLSSAASKRKTSYTFQEVKSKVITMFHNKVEQDKLSETERNLRQEREHLATLGDEQAMNMLMEEITEFLRGTEMKDTPFDPMFRSLEHALFEHIYRFKNFYKWNLYPKSPSAKITGKEIWFKIDGQFVKQKEEFESIEEVNEIIRLLQHSNPNFVIGPGQPEGELDLPDGTRITLTIPPRTLYPTIVFRRFVVSTFSLDMQKSLGTIDERDVPLFKYLAQKRLNTVIAGGVESGKSTFLKTLYKERDEDLVALMIEGHPETYLKRDFPERLVHEFSVSESDIKTVLRTILRFDHDYVIMQEVRGVEADAAIDGASRGAQGLLMTYHVSEPSKVCEQLAQHIVDEYPNRKTVNEIRRVAQTLQLGITMKNFRNPITKKSSKKVTSLFEIVYDYDRDEAWIQYLMKFDLKTGEWQYNSRISPQTQSFLKEDDNGEYEAFFSLLQSREAESKLKDYIQPIIFREGGN